MKKLNNLLAATDFSAAGNLAAARACQLAENLSSQLELIHVFNLQALHFARGVACVRTALYHYRKHPGSATARPLASESARVRRVCRSPRVCNLAMWELLMEPSAMC